jgi:hypothetical protein
MRHFTVRFPPILPVVGKSGRDPLDWVHGDRWKWPWAPKTRRGEGGVGSADDDDGAGIEISLLVGQVDELMKERARLFSLIANEFVYDMMQPGEKERLAADLWADKLEPSISTLRATNPELVALLCAKMPNTSPSTEHARAAEEQHLGALCEICKAHCDDLGFSSVLLLKMRARTCG